MRQFEIMSLNVWENCVFTCGVAEQVHRMLGAVVVYVLVVGHNLR